MFVLAPTIRTCDESERDGLAYLMEASRVMGSGVEVVELIGHRCLD